MKYAKLINDNPKYWPGHCIINGNTICSNDPTTLHDGWKILDETVPEKKDGYIIVYDGWEQDETYVHHVYHYEYIPTPEPSMEDRLTNLEGNVSDIINGVTE